MNDIAEDAKSPIITPGDQERFPLLEMRSQLCNIPITSEDEQAIIYMDDILNRMGESAAGLAAVQIGYPKRIFLIRKHGENKAYINPYIVSKSKEQKLDGEACLSLPGLGGVFKRPKQVVLEYVTITGTVERETFNGFDARVVMHEMDHLDGVLIARHMEERANAKGQRTKFGMRITPHSKKKIAQRRAKKARAKQARRHLRSIRG